MKRALFIGSVILTLPFFLSSFFFFSKPTYWSLQQTEVEGRKAALIQYEPHDKKWGLGVEFLFLNNQMSSTLSFYNVSLDEDEFESYVPLVMQTTNGTHFGYAFCLIGGQKLLLDEESNAFLRSSLEVEQSPVKIDVYGYSCTLHPDNYGKLLRKLNSKN